MTRCALMSGELGSHQGLPVTITATVELKDLQARTGVATTGGGTLLPIKDVIRMAAHAYNYLLIFDDATRCELYKGRTTRLATPAQRLVLYAIERGCSHPGCDIPPYWCQVHHATKDFAKGGQTNIDEETLACGPHNRGSCDVVVGSLTWEFGRNAVSCLRFGLIQGSRRRRSYGVAHVQGIRDRSG